MARLVIITEHEMHKYVLNKYVKMQMKFKRSLYLLYRLMSPVIDPYQLSMSIPRYGAYFRDLMKYIRLDGAESKSIKITDVYPCIHEKSSTSSFDSHYFYLNIWAAQRIMENKPGLHVDVGSKVDFVGFLTCFANVISIDIRPLNVRLNNFEPLSGDILALPFGDGTVRSLSCLHVAEHIGLGRYGDPLNPKGTEMAAKELSRVLAKDGNLFFALPVGKPKVCFNAHRIHSPHQILQYFNELELVEFSGVDDAGVYKRNRQISDLENSNYACGFFWFKKQQIGASD